MIRTWILSSFAALTAFCGAARADVLFERTVMVDRSANIFTSLDFDLDLVATDDFLSPTEITKLFDGLSITPADVGTTYTVNATDSAFAAIAAKLTDSQDEVVKIVLSEMSTGRSEERGFNERNFFFAANPVLPPDLAGNTIGSISLTIDQFTLDFGNNVGGAVASPPVELALTISFNGVPEPQTWALAGTAFAALICVTWISRRKSKLAYAPVRTHHLRK